MAPAAISFDLDGTIWDSYPWFAEVLSQVAPVEASAIEAQLRSGGNIVALANAHHARREFVQECDSTGASVPLYPGAVETLTELIRRGVLVGAATSLPGDLVEVMVRGSGLGKFFSDVVHAGNCRARKPSPLPLLACFQRLGAPLNSELWYIGDRRMDQQAAKAAALRFGWATYGYVDDIDPTAVDHRLQSISDTLTL